jgi:hypothetical protein
MELQTLFKRESVADPFFLRIKQITPSSVLFNSGVPSVPYQDPKLGGQESRFQRNCRFKKGGVLRPRKNIDQPLTKVRNYKETVCATSKYDLCCCSSFPYILQFPSRPVWSSSNTNTTPCTGHKAYRE